jgi:hypothetical protein
MSTARVQISPSAPRRRGLHIVRGGVFSSREKPKYGEIPKWFKGPVLKTGRWVTPTQGFESLSLRHRRNLEISMISRFLAYQNIVVFP